MEIMRSAGISWGRVTVVAALGLVVPAAARAEMQAPATQRAIRAEDALADVRALAAPALGGRGALTTGLRAAADYVAARLGAAGVAPAGEAGTFFQAVDIPLSRRLGPETRLALDGEALAPGVDFTPNVGSPSTTAAGAIVFAGICDAADYAGLDARGKLVLCVPGGPALGTKVELAAARGAVALLVATPSRTAELTPLATLAPVGPSTIPSFRVRAAIVDRLRARATASSGSSSSSSFELPTWGTFRVDWVAPVVRGRNVIGVVAGADPALAGEAVLVGAHYDHLGQGDEGGALDGPGLYPGADDNASGIAAMLEAAEALAGETPRPRRSIVFVAFTGEEKGLIGSMFMAAHAPRKVVAMINFDMVGRMREGRLEVQGTPTSPGWREIVEAANVERLALSFPPRVARNSDHAPFILGGVPALLLHTGMHGDYHRRSDTADKIDGDGIARAARLAARVARAVADRPARLAFAGPIWTTARAGAGGVP
jgi:hypothetical protein